MIIKLFIYFNLYTSSVRLKNIENSVAIITLKGSVTKL